MKYVKSYYVSPEGSGRITVPRGATAFAVFWEPGLGNVRLCMAIDDTLESEHREVFVLRDEEPFEPEGPVKYVGTVIGSQTGRPVALYHVLISQPAQQPGATPVPLASLPPELQERIREVLEKKQKDEAAPPSEG